MIMLYINNNATLEDLNLGEEGIIKEVLLKGEVRSRLFDLGFIKGSKVKCILKSPFEDLTAYFIKGTTIALREEVSKNILWEKEIKQ